VKYVAPLWLLLLLAPSLGAQAADPKLTDVERAGQRLFLQRCALCHLGAAPTYEPYAVALDAQLVATRQEPRVREYILKGSPTMPGWQYSLSESQVTSIIAYLKTLKSPAPR
jgi:mono/diheme cytochrome c family protein